MITGELKKELQKFLFPNYSISNGAITITMVRTDNDFTIKLINSKPSENIENQQGTFTFYKDTSGGGGGVPEV